MKDFKLDTVEEAIQYIETQAGEDGDVFLTEAIGVIKQYTEKSVSWDSLDSLLDQANSFRAANVRPYIWVDKFYDVEKFKKHKSKELQKLWNDYWYDLEVKTDGKGSVYVYNWANGYTFMCFINESSGKISMEHTMSMNSMQLDLMQKTVTIMEDN